MDRFDLEAQLLEEPLGLSTLILGLQDLFQIAADLLFLCGILQQLTADRRGGLQLKAVTSGHQVRIVDHLDKGLDARALGNLLFVH